MRDVDNLGLRERRGQPLVMLAVLLLVWILSRAIFWQLPLASSSELGEPLAPQLAAQEKVKPSEAVTSANTLAYTSAGDGGSRRAEAKGEPKGTVPEQPVALGPDSRAVPVSTAAPRSAATHQRIRLAETADLPVSNVLNGSFDQVARPAKARPDQPTGRLAGAERWTLDIWTLWREGSSIAPASQGRLPTYGASQAGAVLRRHLAPGSAVDPHAYGRVYRALIKDGESEVAFGVSAIPFSKVPVRAHAELRVTEFVDGTRLRPAAFIVTELPVARLPVGLRGEAYAQAGFVAGEASTAFVEGQMHVLRSVGHFDIGELSVAAAAWGGAQEGAERVDLGPSLRFDLTIGEAPVRLSVDYRERVAGDAEPPSGAALTLSARF